MLYRLRWFSKARPGIQGSNRWVTNTFRNKAKFEARVKYFIDNGIQFEILQ